MPTAPNHPGVSLRAGGYGREPELSGPLGAVCDFLFWTGLFECSQNDPQGAAEDFANIVDSAHDAEVREARDEALERKGDERRETVRETMERLEGERRRAA